MVFLPCRYSKSKKIDYTERNATIQDLVKAWVLIKIRLY